MFIFIFITILWFLFISCSIYIACRLSMLNNNRASQNINQNAHYTSFYDGFPLTQPPQRKIKGKLKDCSSYIIKCHSDAECLQSCSILEFERARSIPYCDDTNSCAYKYHTPDNHAVCLNGGVPIQNMAMGTLGCACTDDFVGRYCEVPNLLKPTQTNTFILGEAQQKLRVLNENRRMWVGYKWKLIGITNCALPLSFHRPKGERFHY